MAERAGKSRENENSVNPFVDTTTLPMTESGGYLLALLAPLCVFRVFIGICGIWVYTILLLILQRPSGASGDPYKPQFRSYPFIIRASRAVGNFMLFCLGFTVNIRGSEVLADAHARVVAPIVVANHVSYLDIFLAAAVLGPYYPVARADISGWVRSPPSGCSSSAGGPAPASACLPAPPPLAALPLPLPLLSSSHASGRNPPTDAPPCRPAPRPAQPVFGRLIKLWGFAGVDRKPDAKVERAKRGEGLVSKLAERSRLQGPWELHPPIIVFPEGARSPSLFPPASPPTPRHAVHARQRALGARLPPHRRRCCAAAHGAAPPAQLRLHRKPAGVRKRHCCAGVLGLPSGARKNCTAIARTVIAGCRPDRWRRGVERGIER